MQTNILEVKVKNLMLTDFPIVDKDDTLSHALKLMSKYGIDRAIAVEEGELVGIITKKDVMERLGTIRTRNVQPSSLYVSSVMTSNPIAISPDVKAINSAKLMMEKDVSSFPIVEEGKLKGLITKVELVTLCKNDKTSISKLMSWNPLYVRSTDRILHARQVLRNYSITTLPVVEENKVIGLLTIDDVADALAKFHDIVPEKHRKERIMHLIVTDVMKVRFPMFNMNASLSEVVEELVPRRLKGAPVINRENILVGVITLTDIVRYIANEFRTI